MAKTGRPTSYNPEIAEVICAGIAEGLLLPEVCKRPGMPSPATIFVWLNRFPEFQEQYGKAKEIQCEILAAETKDVADTPRVGRRVKTFADGSQEVTEGDMVDRRLMVDARKWLGAPDCRIYSAFPIRLFLKRTVREVASMTLTPSDNAQARGLSGEIRARERERQADFLAAQVVEIASTATLTHGIDPAEDQDSSANAALIRGVGRPTVTCR